MKEENQVQNRLIVGIDLHPDTFTAAAFSGFSVHTCKRLWVHDKVPTENWGSYLKKHIPKSSVLIMEAGSNSFIFSEIASKLNYNPVVLDSFKIGQIAKQYCKTDKTDAEKIAKVYLSGLCEQNVWIPDNLTRCKREILSEYRRAVKDSTRAKNRFRSFLTSHKIRLQGKYARVTQDETYTYILALKEWTGSQKIMLNIQFEDIKHNEAKRKELRKLISNEVLNSEYGQKLLSLCGVRVICAYSIMASVGDINRFKNAKKLVAYFGFNPSDHESGGTAKKGRLNRRGRKDVKSVLIQSAQAVMRSRNNSGERLRKWGMALSFRKDKNVAIAAVARKLTVAIWYTLKGYMPEIIKVDNDIKRKLKKIAEELKLEGVKTLGYEKVKDFIEEYSQIIQLRS